MRTAVVSRSMNRILYRVTFRTLKESRNKRKVKYDIQSHTITHKLKEHPVEEKKAILNMNQKKI